ncbi:MAG: rRNA maturation RNase YbeY [Ignavibacteriales bacterium]|nr:rRNA maturation RNase YbeY [Ignavibacteriales bacterium]
MIFVAHHHPSLRFPKRETFRVVQSVLEHESVRSFQVSVVFVGSRFIRRINRRYLRHDVVTDVIAFPLGEGKGAPLEGEIYVNLDRAKSQAREYAVPFAEEARRLLIHGTLHLLGYTDTDGRRKARMTKREDRILARLAGSNRE